MASINGGFNNFKKLNLNLQTKKIKLQEEEVKSNPKENVNEKVEQKGKQEVEKMSSTKLLNFLEQANNINVSNKASAADRTETKTEIDQYGNKTVTTKRYDNDGNLINEIVEFYNKEGKLISRETNTYHENGNKKSSLSESDFDENGKPRKKVECEWDKNGKCILEQITRYKEDGSYSLKGTRYNNGDTVKLEEHYDKNGRVKATRTEEHTSAGKKTTIIEYKYTVVGKEVRTEIRNEDGTRSVTIEKFNRKNQLTEKETKIYDKDGNLVKTIIEESDIGMNLKIDDVDLKIERSMVFDFKNNKMIK